MIVQLAKRDRVFACVFALLLVATAAPIWAGRYLPLLDLPNHLSAIKVWHSLNDPALDFSKYYRLNLVPLPYWIHYYSVHLLAYVLDVELANKVYLTAYALALPLGVLALALHAERSHWLSLFAFPLVWNVNLAEGFVAFVSGTAVLPWAVIAVDRHVSSPTVKRGALVFLVGIALYFCHLIPFVLFLAFAGLIVSSRFSARRFLRWLAAGAPAAAVAVVGYGAYWFSNSMRFHGLRNTGVREFIELSPPEKLALLVPRLLNLLSSDLDELVVLVLAVCFLALAIVTRKRQAESARGYVVEICFVVTAVAYMLLPKSMMRPFYWHMIDGRVVMVVAVFAPLLIRRPIEGVARWWLAPVAAAVLLYDVGVYRAFAAFNARVRDFDDIVQKIPLHRRTLTLMVPPLTEPELNVNAYNQWPSYTQIRRGGYNFYNFNEGFPLKYRLRLPAPQWDHANRFKFDEHGALWDYFLTHNEGSLTFMSEAAKRGKVRLIAEQGRWRLWERIGPPATEPQPIPDEVLEKEVR